MVQEPARTRALGLISEEVLAHVPGFTVDGTAWATRLPGGTMNASFMVETGAGRFVVRIQNEAAAALGADHEREASLHAVAAAAGLAPGLIHVGGGLADRLRAGESGATSRPRFMVMEHVGDNVWSVEDMARPERLRQLGAALHHLHSVAPPSVAPFDIGASIERLHERLYAALPDEAAHLSQLMDRARATLLASGSAQRPKTVIHNDLHHTNLIGGPRLWLVDWEYAAVTDPLLDLACVLAYYPRAAAHTDALLDSSRLAALASPEMLRAATWLFVLVSYLWYRARRLAGPVSEADLAAERELLARLA
ncbi:MAG: aminoglycoside phosphotransferase family protein [Gammaproteobacteria bacterium]